VADRREQTERQFRIAVGEQTIGGGRQLQLT
jgi:hypothetical protein